MDDNSVQTTSANIDQQKIDKAIKTAVEANIDQQKIDEVIKTAVEVKLANIDQKKIDEAIKSAVEVKLANIDVKDAFDTAVQAKLTEAVDAAFKTKLDATVKSDIEPLREKIEEVNTFLENDFMKFIEKNDKKIATVEVSLRQSLNSEIATVEKSLRQSFNCEIDTVKGSLLQSINSENGKITDQLRGTLENLGKLEKEFYEFKSNASSVITGFKELEQVAIRSKAFDSVAASYEDVIIKVCSYARSLNPNPENMRKQAKPVDKFVGSNTSTTENLLAQLNQSKESVNEGSNTLTTSKDLLAQIEQIRKSENKGSTTSTTSTTPNLKLSPVEQLRMRMGI